MQSKCVIPTPATVYTEFLIKAPRLDACGVFGAEEAQLIFRVHGVLVDLVNDIVLRLLPPHDSCLHGAILSI